MRNGSGSYSLPVNTWNPATNGVSASAADWQSLINDVASALTASLAADGQTPMTGNLAMGNNRLTGLGAGTATGQSVRWEQLFSQGVEADIASATTTDIGAQNTNFLRVTGTTTITGFGTNYNGPRFLRFAGAVLLTHGSALILPTAANITTAAGDLAIAIPKATTGTADGWIVLYQKASGLPTSTTGLAASGANTDITSLASPAIAAATATTQATTDISTKVATTAYAQSVSAKIQPVTASIASNAITVNLGPTTLDFRNTTLTTGTPVSVSSAVAVSLVIAATDSFGLVTAAGNQRLAILAINNAGAIELAAVALYGGVAIDETGVITTAITATTSTGIKAAAVRTGVAYRVVGYVDATFTTAVGWGSLALVQGAGGNAAESIGSIGYGQTWQTVTGSRALATTYYNTTGKPIQVCVTCGTTGPSTGVFTLTVGGVVVGESGFVNNAGSSPSVLLPITAIVPPGASYSAQQTVATLTLNRWTELR
jgi:hypothetical protein